MIVAVASGKGGTGKTTVAVSLALSLAAGQQDLPGPGSADPGQPSFNPGLPNPPHPNARGGLSNPPPPLFLDCDVEEPNAALFLKPTIQERREVGQLIPEVDAGACIYCGRCAEVCQYHAIAVVGQKVLVFPELCHSCGSCSLNCPADAIREVLHVTGTIERGWAGLPSEAGGLGRVEFAQGTMNVGEPMAVPIIRQLKRWAIGSISSAPSVPGERPIILDASPGTACPVVETMRGADCVLMVTEPTPFGLHDLRLAIEVARGELGLPVGVVVNRDGVGDQGVDEYCAAEGVPILMRIPLDRYIAEAYSEGLPLVEALGAYRARFIALWERLEQLCYRGEGAPSPSQGEGRGEGTPSPSQGEGRGEGAPSPSQGEGRGEGTPSPSQGEGRGEG